MRSSFFCLVFKVVRSDRVGEVSVRLCFQGCSVSRVGFFFLRQDVLGMVFRWFVERKGFVFQDWVFRCGWFWIGSVVFTIFLFFSSFRGFIYGVLQRLDQYFRIRLFYGVCVEENMFLYIEIQVIYGDRTGVFGCFRV